MLPGVPRVPVVDDSHLMPRCWADRFARKLLSMCGKRRVTSENARVTFCNTAYSIKHLSRTREQRAAYPKSVSIVSRKLC